MLVMPPDAKKQKGRISAALLFYLAPEVGLEPTTP
jgi:hypothetical protein